MGVELVIVLLAALAIVFALRLRQRLALLAAQIRALREHALEHVTYRPCSEGELGDALRGATEEAERLGFVMLGDHVEESKVQVAQPMRWFVDKPGTTFGWMAPFEVDGVRHVIVVLMSHELDAQTITARQPPASTLSRPPFVTLQQVDPSASLEATVQKHRARAGLDDPERAFIPVRTFEQLRHELDRMRGKVIDWRCAQPRDELLDADLRSLLGAQYPKLAGAMKRRLG